MSKTLHPERPPIVIAGEDVERLETLAKSAMHHNADVAEELLTEISRAEIRPVQALPSNIVRMNSLVEFETDTGSRLIMRLVYPEEADFAAGRISILTPIGTALIGLTTGQTMKWTDRLGQERTLRITAVTAKP